MATSAVLEKPDSGRSVPARRRAPQRVVRVLHVINGEHYAGAERVQDLLAAGLGREGFRVGFACLKPGRFAAARQDQNAPLYALPMRHRFDLSVVWRLVRIIRRGRYELLHSHSTRSALVAGLAAKIAGVPMVHHVHSPTSRDSTHRRRDRLNAMVERIVLGSASALIAVSGSLGRHLRQRGFDDRIVTVVPNGVPGRQAAPVRDCSKHGWTLGTVALFRPRKGIEVLLRAVAMLRREGLPVRLRAVGGFETPEYRREIERLVEELGLGDAVDWTGFSQDVDRELMQMDLFVLPSLFGEGLPMVLLEAMSAGLPVVATAVEGIPEAVRHGRDGLIAEPNDPHALAALLGRVIRGEVDRRRLRRSALQRHAESFSEKAMAAGVAGVYRRVL